MDLKAALERQLRRAAEAFGADLPLPVPARRGALAAAPHPAPAPATGPAPECGPESGTGLAEDTAPASARTLDALRALALPCTRCKLSRLGRTQVVFGEGSPEARVMFVGEAPGGREDAEGRPFVGPAGQLLTRIIENAMGLARTDVYIANVAKCRPPKNRNPEPDEVAACLPFLRRQVELVAPEVIVALGRVAAQSLLSTTRPMRALRGARLSYLGIPVVVTWHPAYLLRQPDAKRETWEDIKRVNHALGLPDLPTRRGPAPPGPKAPPRGR